MLTPKDDYPTQEEIEISAHILSTYIQDQVTRLVYGINARRALVKKAKAGEKLTGYRIDWIRLVSKRLVEQLRVEIASFGAAYPWDKISRMDIADVLRSTATLESGGDGNVIGEEDS